MDKPAPMAMRGAKACVNLAVKAGGERFYGFQSLRRRYALRGQSSDEEQPWAGPAGSPHLALSNF